jgi:hypothetical protein
VTMLLDYYEEQYLQDWVIQKAVDRQKEEQSSGYSRF